MSSMKCLPAFALAAWASTGPSLAQGRLPIAMKTIVEKTAIYEARFAYPHTGNATIDADIERWAKDFADGFKATSTRISPASTAQCRMNMSAKR